MGSELCAVQLDTSVEQSDTEYGTDKDKRVDDGHTTEPDRYACEHQHHCNQR